MVIFLVLRKQRNESTLLLMGCLCRK